MTAYCRWKQYSQGLSHNQHKLIRDFSRKELKASGQLEDLLYARDELHQHFFDATNNRKRADALLAARYAGLTSSKLTYEEAPDFDLVGNSMESSLRLITPTQNSEIKVKEVPDFSSFSM